MKRILFLYLAYPFAIASYFRHALEKRKDVDLVTCGAYTGDYIPWAGGMRLPARYVKSVDLPLSASVLKPTWGTIKNGMTKNKLGDFDLIINCDAGFHLADKPDVPYAVIATDPHVLGDWYKDVRPRADYFFGMQRYYLENGDVHLPYAFSPDHHYAMSVEKDYDASLIGLHYSQRDQLVSALRGKGVRVRYDIGLVYNEYCEMNNRAAIGLNWSSRMDINARFFETMAMRQVLVTNRLPHIDELGFEEGRHYLGFNDVAEAVEKVEWALGNSNQAEAIAINGYQLVQNHTYENRVQKVFDTVGI